MRIHSLLAIALGLSLLASGTAIFTVPVSSQGNSSFPNCRLGVIAKRPPSTYPNIHELNLGWYGNFFPDRTTVPAGMEFIRTIRLNQQHGDPYSCKYGSYSCYSTPPTYTLTVPPSMPELAQLVGDNPGSLWAVGNEPDGRQWWTDGVKWVGQDETTPELYARAYCEISRLIRDTDPTARVAIGGVIEATPLRMEYLDRIWNAYPGVCNGRSLGDDVDVWNIHNYVLREASHLCYPRDEAWGAEIPPGLDQYCKGKWYQPEDSGRVDLAKEQIVRFRTWMASHGQRNKPLIVTEAGPIMGSYWHLPAEVQAFMTDYLDLVLNEKDVNIGDPFDENRLVQRFLWMSLDVNATVDPDQVSSDLCYPNCTLDADSLLGTVTQQAYRQHWVSYVTDPGHPEASVPRINPIVGSTSTGSSSYGEPTGPVTLTLQANIYNSGNTLPAPGVVQVAFYQGVHGDPGATPIGSSQSADSFCGCGQGILVQQTWVIQGNPPAKGAYPWYVSVTVDGQERAFGSGTGLVGGIPTFAPVIVKGSG